MAVRTGRDAWRQLRQLGADLVEITIDRFTIVPWGDSDQVPDAAVDFVIAHHRLLLASVTPRDCSVCYGCGGMALPGVGLCLGCHAGEIAAGLM